MVILCRDNGDIDDDDDDNGDIDVANGDIDVANGDIDVNSYKSHVKKCDIGLIMVF